MNVKFRFVFVLLLILIFVASCGVAAPAEEPAVVEEPAEPASIDLNEIVVVLVVDAFSSGQIEQGQDEPNCSVTPDGQKYRGEESAAAPLGIPHGIYVYKDLIRQVDDSGEFFLLTNEGLDFSGTQSLVNAVWLKRYDMYTFNRSPETGLLVVSVDTDGLNLDSITNNIAAAFDEFSGQNSLQLGGVDIPPTNRFVVNMSFVLLPCNPDSILDGNIGSILVDYKVNDEEIFKKYEVDGEFMFNTVQDLKGGYYENAMGTFKSDVNSIKPLDDLRKRYEVLFEGYAPERLSDKLDEIVFDAFISYLIYDPSLNRDWQYDYFYDTLYNYYVNKGLEIVYVGAAGNFWDNFSYAPASWDFVVSVSSEPSHQDIADGLNLAKYSNWGEVQMDGVFPFDSKIIGTSFAAPVFSYSIAHYLITGGTSPCQNSDPALGYATVKDPWPRDQNNNYLDNNLTFDDAMLQYCP